MAAWDFNGYREKHELLSFVEKEITESMDHLPQPRDILEEDYTRIIRASFDDRMRLAFESSRSYEEMTEPSGGMQSTQRWNSVSETGFRQVKYPVFTADCFMYYKQVIEGYDDKERFDIMQKVGMSCHEVKKTINSQVLTVFFIPLLGAGVHMAFAAFALFYVASYLITSKAYYRVVAA